jgi:hypothetical protein
MKSVFGSLLVFAMLLISTGIVNAQGYGTSMIVLSQTILNVTPGATASIDYTVELASGSTWGTTLVVTNAAQLQQQGITVNMSNPSGDPPYSGVLTVATSQTTGSRIYTITLAAIGDDPSQVNVELLVNVDPSAVTTTIAAPGQTTTVAQATSTVMTTVSQTYYPSTGSELAVASSALIFVIAVVTAYLAVRWKTMLARLAILGTGLILVGTVAWIYGDYAGGLMTYLWGGVAAIALGTVIWIYGDYAGGTFKQSLPGKLVYAGVALIAAGTLLWLYADYYLAGSQLYIWSGVVMLVVGSAVWLYADAKAGAFMKPANK